MIPLPSLSPDLAPVREALDAARPDQRVNWMRGLGAGELRALWVHAEARPAPLPLDHLVDGDGVVVIHHGVNSLPVFSLFQKRFVRRGGVVQGYNHNPPSVSWFTGPGHFTARQDGPEAILIDYTQLPADVPAELPPLVGNDAGTRRLVFGGMQDRLLRVSAHCTIGRAYRGGEAMRAWFMLTRDAPAGDALGA